MERIQTIVETGIYVNDLSQAETFYGDILGLEIIAKDPQRHVFFRVGDSSVLLAFLPDASRAGEKAPPHGAQGSGHFALGISAESYENWRSRLLHFGIAIEKEIQWPQGGRSLYFRDPSQNSVELLTPGLWGLPSGW